MSSAKRALNFGSTPAKKRRRAASKGAVIYRMSKPEMKAADFTLSHVTATASNTDLTQLTPGTGVNNRIGNRVKAWRVQGRFIGSVPFRIEILMMNDASDTPSNTSTTLYNYRRAVSLGSYVYDWTVSNSVCDFDHRLPMGLNITYDGTAATDCTRGKIFARITTAVSTTIDGEFRLYFTDT